MGQEWWLGRQGNSWEQLARQAARRRDVGDCQEGQEARGLTRALRR